MLQKRRAAAHDVGIRRAEIIGVPRVGDAALLPRERQQRTDLAVRVVREDAAEVARVVFVHRQQPVIGVVVARRDLHGGAVTDGGRRARAARRVRAGRRRCRSPRGWSPPRRCKTAAPAPAAAPCRGRYTPSSGCGRCCRGR